MSSPIQSPRAAGLGQYLSTIGVIGLFAASLFVAVVSAEDCIPTPDMPCRAVALECTDMRNISHFLGAQPTAAYIEDAVTEMSRDVPTNTSMTYRYDFTGSVKLSDIFPDTFETIHLPAILAYELCEDYVNNFSQELESGIIAFLGTEAELSISVFDCEFLYQPSPPPLAPPPSRKLLNNTAAVDLFDMRAFYTGYDTTSNETITFADKSGVSTAGVNGSISVPAISLARRRLMQAGGAEEEHELCRLSLMFRGYVAASYDEGKPWQQNSAATQFTCTADFREEYSSGDSIPLSVADACRVEDGLKFMEESCGPSPVKTLVDFPEIFPAGFDPVSEIMPTLQSHQPPPSPGFLPDSDICTASPESICDFANIFGEEVVRYMLSWYTPNDLPSITLLEEFYQAIC